MFPGTDPIVDPEVTVVGGYFRGFRDLEQRAGQAIREAIDLVIAGRYTGRYSIDQLDKTEKTYIGTKVEQLVLDAFGLPNMQHIDTRVLGIKVDVKFSIHGNWAIPKEAFGEICLLISADDGRSTFDMGLLRTTEELLNPGQNKDGKHTIRHETRRHILWLVKGGLLPPNLFLHLDPRVREAVLEKPAGQQRVNEFFRRCRDVAVNGTVVEALAEQRDSSKRVRDARKALRAEGILIYSHYNNDELRALGYGTLKAGEFISIYQSRVPDDAADSHTD